MTPEEFVRLFYNKKESIIDNYFDGADNTAVGNGIANLKLSNNQIDKLKHIINLVITDTMYTILLGLDGDASIGGVQEDYKLFDSQGNLLTDCGEIEASAWHFFHEDLNQ